jgi:hypothetical protein
MVKKMAHFGISGAFPWAWTYSLVLRGPDETWREEKYPEHQGYGRPRDRQQIIETPVK